MPDYRRAWYPGGTYFFTVNLLPRHGNDLLTRHIDLLRDVLRDVRRRHPFTIHGWVVLPEHMHCVIELPLGDSDFATRWRLIKADFSKCSPVNERRSAVRRARGERGIWQRRFWELLIRDEGDFKAHMDYVPQPRQTWPRDPGGRLALFDVPPAGGCRHLSAGLGGECRRG